MMAAARRHWPWWLLACRLLLRSGSVYVSPEEEEAVPSPTPVAQSKEEEEVRCRRPFLASLMLADNYNYMALASVLAHTVRDVGEFNGSLVMLVGLPNGTRLSPSGEKMLKTAGWQLNYVSQISAPWPRDECERFCDVYTKLRVWQLHDIGKCGIYVDADAMVLKPLHGLVDLATKVKPNTIGIVADSYAKWTLNGGVFVFRPDDATFDNMTKYVSKIEKLAHMRPEGERWEPFERTEQSFIHAYFQPCPNDRNDCDRSRRTALPFTYNCQWGAWGPAHWKKLTADPAYESSKDLRSVDDCTILHFTSEKPFKKQNRYGANLFFDAMHKYKIDTHPSGPPAAAGAGDGDGSHAADASI